MLTPVINLGDPLTQAAGRLPDEAGFITPSRTHTRGEINRRVEAVCSALRTKGVKKGGSKRRALKMAASYRVLGYAA
jgi:fatty-acyl-CoA synthase